jgi:hypothetical protein
MLGGAGIGDHAVKAALLGDDGIEGALDTVDGGDVAVLEGKLAREALGELGEVLARLRDVQAVDGGGVVGEAYLCDAQADALVRASD